MGCNVTVVTAFQQGTLGFGLSDSGWLLPWYIGVVATLQKLGVITPGVTPVGGVSGGAIAAASSCLGITPQAALLDAHANAATCRARWGCAGTLHEVLAKGLRGSVMPLADQLERCAANTYIYYAKGHPLGASLAERIDSSTVEAFFEGVLATCYIPFWGAGGKATTTYQGNPAFEGFYAIPMPCPPGVSVCVRVSSRFVGPLAAPAPAWQSILQKLVELPHSGKPPVPQPGDLHPGKFTPCKFTPFELGYLKALAPGTAEDLQYLYSLGQQDAYAWAESVGLDEAGRAACLAQASSEV